ncbi:MAG: hypothetical protein HY001_05440 [Candidatus Portnoybacteria bacterium]|nr:hypothetical protein [Candidatus Portnoybacteria bacterium]
MILMLVVGGLLGWVIFDNSGRGEPDTPVIGRIYEVVAVEGMRSTTEGELVDYVLLVKDPADRGRKVEFMRIPGSKVEGTILAGKGIMRVEVSIAPGVAIPQYKTGELLELEQKLKELGAQ